MGYSAKLKRPAKLDLQKVKKRFEVILETPILLVIKKEGVEITIHGYGELLFRNCSNTELMEKIAKEIYEAAGFSFA